MNDLREVERHARALMLAHGVGSLGFEFDNSKSRLGACYFQRIGTTTLAKKITLSRHYAAILPMEEIGQTMLHEIAHALTPGHNHDAVWQRKARQLGHTGSRCARPSAVPDHSVEGRCQKCNTVITKGHRLPLRVYFHGACGLTLDGGLAVWYRKGHKVAIQDMPKRYKDEYARIVHSEASKRKRFGT